MCGQELLQVQPGASYIAACVCGSLVNLGSIALELGLHGFQDCLCQECVQVVLKVLCVSIWSPVTTSSLFYVCCSHQQAQSTPCTRQPSMGCQGNAAQCLSSRWLIVLFLFQYLGVIPNLDSWQCPESRTQFLQLVDQAQVSSAFSLPDLLKINFSR